MQVTAELRELVSRAQAGDREAFGRLYAAYRDEVFQYLLGRTEDRPLAEDLTSETFLRAMRAIGSFAWQGANFGAWLTVIARNLAINYFRLHRVRRERPVGDFHDRIRPELSHADPAREVADRLTNERLLASVQSLPPGQRECITLRYLSELSLEETAARMGRTVSAVKSLQNKALKALRGLLPVTAVMPA